MRYQPLLNTRFFFSTTPMPCPYLPNRMERRVVTELIGRDPVTLHEQLSFAGFRRSHGIAYAPACTDCDACKAVRVITREFKPTRSQRRVWSRNCHLGVEICNPVATHEQYRVFSAYQRDRHGDGDMAKMDISDYQGLIENTPVETVQVEFRDGDEKLVAVCLTDRMANALSAVYSFFDPEHEGASLGSHMILWLIKEAKRAGLEYVYLGFWVSNCTKMAYKARFQPMEVRTAEGWEMLKPDAIHDGVAGDLTARSTIPMEVPNNLPFDDLLKPRA